VLDRHTHTLSSRRKTAAAFANRVTSYRRLIATGLSLTVFAVLRLVMD